MGSYQIHKSGPHHKGSSFLSLGNYLGLDLIILKPNLIILNIEMLLLITVDKIGQHASFSMKEKNLGSGEVFLLVFTDSNCFFICLYKDIFRSL